MLSSLQKARVDALLDELLDLPEDRRWQRIRDNHTDDADVLIEVESLLRAGQAAQEFMTSPAQLAADESVEELPPDARFGVWRITRLIGRGGMGEVFEALRAQGDFEQRAAIKLLRHEASAQLERFQAERQILASLDDPGIARLYDGGVASDGRPYMVMEFVEGQSITEYCARISASFEQRLQLFISVCEAVAYAHRNLVIHRDLKPSNILVTASGRVKLLDFGIAKFIDAGRAETQMTLAPLTPGCAAPEQMTGQPVTTATDVYALGVLLFELLTGRHPWMQTNMPVFQALQIVLKKPVQLASRVADSINDSPVSARLIRGDLDAIIAKALRVEPTQRYATVEALKVDVERALHDEPVTAREGARLYVLRRVLRRYRWAVAGIAIVVLSLAGGLGVAAWQAQRAQIERDIARRDAAREEAVRYNLTSLFRSAIADQHAQSTTAKAMIDSSAQRVLRQYHDQPQLAGAIVLTLADLYGALEDVEGAGALLDGFVTEAGPDADPAALADARQKLANIELLRGHRDRASTLLDQSEAFWTKSPQRYTEERLEGLGVRAKLQRMQGDLPGAIATSRRAIEQRTALSGHNHRETAILYNSLAISLTTNGQLNDALQAYRETLDIYKNLGLADGLDAQIVQANTGTLELRTGHLREAQTLLKNAIDRERALAGDSAAVAAAMGYLGKALSIANDEREALNVLQQAVDIGTRYAGAASPVTLQNRLFLGETQLASGDDARARETLTAAHEAALGQYGDAHPLTLRTQLALAQLAASMHDEDSARTSLSGVIEKFRKLGAPAQINLAQALQMQGEVELSQHQIPPAIASLKESVSTFEKTGADTWELETARERLGEALAADGNIASSTTILKQAAKNLQTQLGADHPQTVRARNALARSQT